MVIVTGYKWQVKLSHCRHQHNISKYITEECASDKKLRKWDYHPKICTFFWWKLIKLSYIFTLFQTKQVAYVISFIKGYRLGIQNWWTWVKMLLLLLHFNRKNWKLHNMRIYTRILLLTNLIHTNENHCLNPIYPTIQYDKVMHIHSSWIFTNRKIALYHILSPSSFIHFFQLEFTRLIFNSLKTRA